MACAPLPVGGYECEFVDSIPDSLSCPVCLLPFRDPHLLDCCGAKYCEVCIGRVKASSQPCPLCKQQFNTMLDKKKQRKVLGLKVRCSRKKDGCEWEGELRHLNHHEREECVWALVECRYHCGEWPPRRQLAEHEQDVCSQRPVDVKLESFMRKMEERHMREMATAREDHTRDMATMRENHMKETSSMREDHMKDMSSMREDYMREMAAMRKDHMKEMAVVEEELKKEKESHKEELRKERDEFHTKMKKVEGILERQTAECDGKLKELIPRTEGVITRLNDVEDTVMYHHLNCKFIKHTNYPDGSTVGLFEKFTKGWVVQNAGTIRWHHVTLVHQSGFAPIETNITVPDLAPGEQTELTASYPAVNTATADISVYQKEIHSEWKLFYKGRPTSFSVQLSITASIYVYFEQAK